MHNLDIKYTHRLSSDESSGCPYCDTFISGHQMDKAINHLISEHEGRLLHIGSEYSGTDDHGHTVHFTVAMLGFSMVPLEKTPSQGPRIRFTVAEDGREIT